MYMHVYRKSLYKRSNSFASYSNTPPIPSICIIPKNARILSENNAGTPKIHIVGSSSEKPLTVAVDELAVFEREPTGNNPAGQVSEHRASFARSLHYEAQRKSCKKTVLDWCTALFCPRCDHHRATMLEREREGWSVHWCTTR